MSKKEFSAYCEISAKILKSLGYTTKSAVIEHIRSDYDMFSDIMTVEDMQSEINGISKYFEE